MKTMLLTIALIFSLVTCGFALNLDALTRDVPVETAASEDVMTEEKAHEQAIEAVTADPSPVATQPAEPEVCGDDKRMASIHTVLRTISRDGDLEEPITVTPETFTTLNHNVVSRLGDNLMVCPDNFMLGGELMQPLLVDWPAITGKVRVAITDGDQDYLRWMQRNYRLNPVTGKDIIDQMFVYPAVQNAFLNGLGIRPFAGSSSPVDRHQYAGLAVMHTFGAQLQADDPWTIFVYRQSDRNRSAAAASERFNMQYVVMLQAGVSNVTHRDLLSQLEGMFPTFNIVYE